MAQFRQILCSKRQPNAKRAGVGQHRLLFQADIHSADLAVCRAGLDDERQQIFLRLERLAARDGIDLRDQRILVEHAGHIVGGDLHEIGREDQRQIQNMCIRHGIARPVCANGRGYTNLRGI